MWMLLLVNASIIFLLPNRFRSQRPRNKEWGGGGWGSYLLMALALSVALLQGRECSAVFVIVIAVEQYHNSWHIGFGCWKTSSYSHSMTSIGNETLSKCERRCSVYSEEITVSAPFLQNWSKYTFVYDEFGRFFCSSVMSAARANDVWTHLHRLIAGCCALSEKMNHNTNNNV